MSKTAQDLITLFRSTIDDLVAPYLWSDVEVLAYIDEAQTAFARDTEIFFDSVTPGLTKVPIAPNQTYIPLDSRINRVRRAKLASQDSELSIQNFDSLDPSWDWEKATGTPTTLVLDVSVTQGRLIPISQTADTLLLWVYRDPLISISGVKDVLEVNDPLDMRLGLLNYMKSVAYDKNDSDIHNEQLSELYITKFDKYVIKAKYKYQKQRRQPGFVRYGGL